LCDEVKGTTDERRSTLIPSNAITVEKNAAMARVRESKGRSAPQMVTMNADNGNDRAFAEARGLALGSEIGLPAR